MARFQFFERDVAAQGAVRVQLYPGAVVEHALHVLLDGSRRQAKGRNTPDHHATGPVRHFVDMDRITGFGQVLGSRQPGRPRPDDAHGLGLGHLDWRQMVAATQFLHDIAFQVADGDRPIAVGAPASRLAGRIADAPANRGKWVCCGDGFEGFLDFSFPDVSDVGRRIGPHRAGHLTGCGNEIDVIDVIGETRGRRAGCDAGDVVNAHVNLPC